MSTLTTGNLKLTRPDFNDTIGAAIPAIAANMDTIDSAVTQLQSNTSTGGTTGITNDLTQRGINVKNYGAKGDGTTDDTSAIQTALAAATPGVGKVFIPGGSYKITGTLVIPASVTLEMASDTTLFAYADVHVIQLKLNANVNGNGGTIDTTNVSTFSHACIFINTDDFCSMTTTYVDNVNMNAGSGTPCPGYGFYAFASQPTASTGNTWLSFMTSRNLKITGYNKGIYLHAQANSGASGGSWINGNNFIDFSIYNCVYGIYLDGAAFTTANACGGNVFSDFQIQCSSNMQRGIYVTGDQNVFRGQIWDYTSMNIAGGALAVEFAGGSISEYNYVEVPGLDDTTMQYWKDGQMGNTGRNIVKSPNTSSGALLPSAPFQSAFNGNQDDVLAFADKRWTVTQSSGPAIDIGQLGNAFNLNGDSDVSWVNVTTANPVVILIDMTSSPLSWLQTFGIQSMYDEAPQNIKVETYNGTAWQTAFNITGNYSNRIVQKDLGQTTVNQIRLTVSGSTNSTSNRLRLGRIFANATNPIGPYVTVDGSNPALSATGNFTTLSVSGTSTFGGVMTVNNNAQVNGTTTLQNVNVQSGYSLTCPTYTGANMYSNTTVYGFTPQAGGQFSFNDHTNATQLLYIKDSDQSVNIGSYLGLGHVASLPTADATKRGMVVTVQGNGTTTADIAYVCLMSATGTYSWKQLISG